MDRPHRASDTSRANTPDDTVRGGGSPLAAVSSGELVFNPATTSPVGDEPSIQQAMSGGLSLHVGPRRGMPPRQQSAQHGTLERHRHLHSASPFFGHIESSHGAKGNGNCMQAAVSGTGSASNNVGALDSSRGPFFLNARPTQASPMTRSSPYDLSQAAVYVTAPSQLSGMCNTSTTTSLAAPRVASYWSYLFNHQGSGPSLHRG